MIKVVTALKKRKEIWFPDEPTFVACSKRLNEPDAMRKIMDDEEGCLTPEKSVAT